MGDEPKKNDDGLIVWVTNPRKMMVSLYGWRTTKKNDENMKWGLIVMGDLPWWKKYDEVRSHCHGWPTRKWKKNMKCGLIVMGDLPRWKKYDEVVSLRWATYPMIKCEETRKWSNCSRRPARWWNTWKWFQQWTSMAFHSCLLESSLVIFDLYGWDLICKSISKMM